MEIERFEQRLKAAKEGPGDPQNITDFEKRIEKLRTDRERLKKIAAFNICSFYTLDHRATLRAGVS